jgi:hypothetical protein
MEIGLADETPPHHQGQRPNAADMWRDPGIEPSLEDVLSDPLVHLVMRRDRLSVADVRQVMDITQARLLVTNASSAMGPAS